MSRFYSSSDRHRKQLPLTPTEQQPPVASPTCEKHHNCGKEKTTTNHSVHGGSKSVAAHPPQPFQGANMEHQVVSSSAFPFTQAKNVKKPTGGSEQKLGTATGGTGVVLPIYCTTVTRTRGDDLNNDGAWVALKSPH